VEASYNQKTHTVTRISQQIKMKKISLVITVVDEEQTIKKLLESVLRQTLLPDEVIIVDGGSTDNTVDIIRNFTLELEKRSRASKKTYPKITVKTKKGNRSIGRNFAIKNSKNHFIAITDAGCILDKNWLNELLVKYEKSNAPVIAGYYSAKPANDFQRAVVPYALVMPDQVDPQNFLPATRSMLIEKKLFQKLGGFDEKLSDNEDYAFAKKLQKQKIKIAFARKAIAYWFPRKNLKQFYNMIFRFARGDIYAGILRPKVILIFARYFIFIAILIISPKLFLATLLFYSVWAIQKNKKYVGGGYKYLPILQFTSDIAVMHGSLIGASQKFS
jgi:glycosyltransferase involved in cell wall biosynthesis